jgi:hypothetical protein
MLRNLQTFIKLLYQKLSLPTFKQDQQLRDLYNNDQHSNEEQSNRKVEILKRSADIHHELRKSNISKTMPSRPDDFAEEKSRCSDNRVPLKRIHFRDHFFSIVPTDHITYQLTLHYRCETEDNTAFHPNRVKKSMQQVHQLLCQTYVHKRRYNHPNVRHLQPFIFSVLEYHALVAVHPDLADKFDELSVLNKFQRFDPKITRSHFARTKPDAIKVKDHTTITNALTFANYCVKKLKDLDDITIYAPIQN